MKELDQYLKGELSFTPIINIIQHDRPALNNVGKLVADKFREGPVPDSIEQYRPIIMMEVKRSFLSLDRYSFIAILFYTGMLGPEVLLSMFGEPLYHNEFGEGLHGVDGVPKQHRRKSYASHFVTVNDTLIHIGYDHRGTTIEVPPSMTPKQVEQILITLVQKLFN